MRYYITLLLFVASVLLGCSKEEQKHHLELSVDKFEIPFSGGNFTVSISSSTQWRASVEESWCKLSPSWGNAGDTIIRVVVEKNAEYSSRQCDIVIESLSDIKRVQILQDCEYTIKLPKDVVVSSGEQDVEIEVSTNIEGPYFVDIPDAAEWITSWSVKSLKTNTLVLHVKGNTSISQTRTAAVVVRSEDNTISETINITQKTAPYIEYTTTNGVLMTAGSESGTVTSIGGVDVVADDYSSGKGILVLEDEFSYIGTSDIRWKCVELESIVLPDCVTEIQDYAFHDFASLKDVVLPNKLEKIGENAFWFCDGLEEIIIPESVTSIGTAAFRECHNLRKVKFPSELTNVGTAMFVWCYELEEVELPKKLNIIGARAFASCKKLKSIELPQTLQVIDEEAFIGCTLLESVSIPDKVDSLGQCAFSGCASLKQIKLPASLRGLAHAVIASTSLVEDTIPAKVEYIVNNTAFGEPHNLQTIIFESLTPPAIVNEPYHNDAPFNTVTEIKVTQQSIDAYKASDWGKYYSKFSAKQ